MRPWLQRVFLTHTCSHRVCISFMKNILWTSQKTTLEAIEKGRWIRKDVSGSIGNVTVNAPNGLVGKELLRAKSSCAFKRNILLQGTLAFAEEHVCFLQVNRSTKASSFIVPFVLAADIGEATVPLMLSDYRCDILGLLQIYKIVQISTVTLPHREMHPVLRR